jgi:hypothetical protein
MALLTVEETNAQKHGEEVDRGQWKENISIPLHVPFCCLHQSSRFERVGS